MGKICERQVMDRMTPGADSSSYSVPTIHAQSTQPAKPDQWAISLSVNHLAGRPCHEPTSG